MGGSGGESRAVAFQDGLDAAVAEGAQHESLAAGALGALRSEAQGETDEGEATTEALLTVEAVGKDLPGHPGCCWPGLRRPVEDSPRCPLQGAVTRWGDARGRWCNRRPGNSAGTSREQDKVVPFSWPLTTRPWLS